MTRSCRSCCARVPGRPRHREGRPGKRLARDREDVAAYWDGLVGSAAGWPPLTWSRCWCKRRARLGGDRPRCLRSRSRRRWTLDWPLMSAGSGTSSAGPTSSPFTQPSSAPRRPHRFIGSAPGARPAALIAAEMISLTGGTAGVTVGGIVAAATSERSRRRTCRAAWPPGFSVRRSTWPVRHLRRCGPNEVLHPVASSDARAGRADHPNLRPQSCEAALH